MIVYPNEEVLCNAEIRRDKQTGQIFIAVKAQDGRSHDSTLERLGKVESPGMMGDRYVIKPR